MWIQEEVPDQEGDWRNPRNYNQHYQENNGFKMKIDLPSVDEKIDIEGFFRWIKNVENFFNYMNTADNKKVKLVAFKLKGGASAWWEQLGRR